MKNVFQIYGNKSFEVPQALLFGKYRELSFESKLMWVVYQKMGCFDKQGLLNLCLSGSRQFIKNEIINELLRFNLIYIKDDFMYFNHVEIDNQIINDINEFENKNVGFVSVPTGTLTKKMKQEQMINKAYFESENVPRDIADTLQTFSNNVEEANEYFSIIMKAKKKVETESENVLWIEHDEELNERIIKSFVRSVRKINQSNINNRSGYMYKAIYASIKGLIDERSYSQNETGALHNWLEE